MSGRSCDRPGAHFVFAHSSAEARISHSSDCDPSPLLLRPSDPTQRRKHIRPSCRSGQVTLCCRRRSSFTGSLPQLGCLQRAARSSWPLSSASELRGSCKARPAKERLRSRPSAPAPPARAAWAQRSHAVSLGAAALKSGCAARSALAPYPLLHDCPCARGLYLRPPTPEPAYASNAMREAPSGA